MIENFNDSTKFVTDIPLQHINWWMLLAAIEFFAIAFLLIERKGKSCRVKSKKKELLQKEIDGDNLFNSAFNAKPLYDKMIREYHPDRFRGDSIKVELATEISSRIVQNKANYKALLALQQEAREKLGTQ